MTQRELSIEVGYSAIHLSRLEGSHRPPDEHTLLALFVPALELQDAPDLVARLLALAIAGRDLPVIPALTSRAPAELEAIPLPPTGEVARPSEFQRLRQRLANERVVAVCALAGMGKTTLAAALARAAAPTRAVFWLTFTAGVTNSASVLIRQLALFLQAHGQSQIMPLLQNEPAAGRSFTLDEQLLLIGVAFARMAGSHANGLITPAAEPPLLCFDNVQIVQGDREIMQVLRHLTTTPAALLLLSRDHVPLPGVAVMRVPGLEPQEGLALISRLSDTVPAALAELLLEKTGGNPLLLRLALGQLHQAADLSNMINYLAHVPEVADLLDAMLEYLTPSAVNLLALVAVFRQPLNLHDRALRDLLEPSDGIDDLPGALAELQRRNLLDLPTQAALHPLLRDYVITRLGADRPRAQRLHEVAALWSERVTSQFVEAAYHYANAGALDRAGELLAEQRHELIQHGQAFAAVDVIDMLLAQVRQRGGSGDINRQLLTLRADLLAGTLRAAEAEANYRAALQQAGPPTIRAQICARLASCLTQRGQPAEAVLMCVEARLPLNPSHALLLAQLLAAESAAQLVLTHYVAAQHTATQALEHTVSIACTAPRAVAEIRVQAHSTIATTLRYGQQFDQAVAHLQQATIAARQSLRPQLANRCQIDIAALCFSQGDLEGAIAACNATVPQLHATNDSHTLARLLSHTSLSYLMHGEVATALATVEQACQIAEDIGDTHCVADSQVRRVRILIALGRVSEARNGAERLLATAATTDEMPLQGYVLDRLAMVQLLAGQAAVAAELFQRALALPAATSDGKLRADLHNHLALALLVCGSDDQAHELLACRATGQLPLSTILTHDLIQAMLLLARGTEAVQITAAVMAIAAEADATKHYLFSNAAQRLLAAIPAPPPRDRFPHLHWIDAV